MPTLHADSSAAELMTYTQRLIQNLGDLLVRDVGAQQAWSVKQQQNVVYAVSFAQFFEKKHLVTYSKKAAKLDARVQQLIGEQADGGKSVAELMGAAQLESAHAKVRRMALNRSGQVVCRACGHARESHQWKKTGGYCKGPPVNDCVCKQFVSDYVDKQVAKFGENPVGKGNMNEFNSSIIMNLIPRQVFEKALLDGLTAPRVQSDPVKHPKEFRLRLDFGTSCKGAVVQANAGVSAGWKVWQGCHVIAERSDASTEQSEIWVINHMETQNNWYF